MPEEPLEERGPIELLVFPLNDDDDDDEEEPPVEPPEFNDMEL